MKELKRLLKIDSGFIKLGTIYTIILSIIFFLFLPFETAILKSIENIVITLIAFMSTIMTYNKIKIGSTFNIFPYLLLSDVIVTFMGVLFDSSNILDMFLTFVIVGVVYWITYVVLNKIINK